MIPIFYSDEFLDHQTGGWHPECPGRLTAIKEHLESRPWANQLEWRSPTPIHQQPIHPLSNGSTPNYPNEPKRDRLQTAIAAVHPPEHIALIRQLATQGGGAIDPDTIVSPRSYDVALLAVSAWLDSVDTVLRTQRPAFALVRPPGHHCTANRAMGFCLFSNAAIAALYALEQDGVERVAILDWDVHHGNGTQAIVEHNPKIRYCSLHESPNYPGTGDRSERGEFENVLNIPMKSGSQLKEYETAFQNEVIPFLQRDCPDLMLVSAGYDAIYADPLSRIALQPDDFGHFTRQCLELTPAIVFGLEGGYDFTTLARAVASTMEPCIMLR